MFCYNSWSQRLSLRTGLLASFWRHSWSVKLARLRSLPVSSPAPGPYHSSKMPATFFNFLKNTKASAIFVGSFPAAYVLWKGVTMTGQRECGHATRCTRSWRALACPR